jgi:hypothetical protein
MGMVTQRASRRAYNLTQQYRDICELRRQIEALVGKNGSKKRPSIFTHENLDVSSVYSMNGSNIQADISEC